MKQHRSSFEETCQNLMGWQIGKVLYTEVDYYPADPRPCYQTEDPVLHTVDFAVLFYNTKGDVASVVWQEAPSGGYTLHLHHNHKPEIAGQRTWEVSQDSLWQPLIGTTITAVKTEQTTAAGHHVLLFVFSKGQTVQIQAAERVAGVSEIVTSNNLLVRLKEEAHRES